MAPADNDRDDGPAVLPRQGAVSAALARVRAFVLAHALDQDTLARLAVVVEELVINLVDHAKLGEGGIVLGLGRTERGTIVSIEDDGAAFDPLAAPPVGDRPPERGGGAGIAIVLAWSRDVAYRSEGGRNVLTLVVPDCC